MARLEGISNDCPGANITRLDLLLLIIIILLFSIDYKIGKIDRRMRERFPTEKEQDRDWAKQDPMGHAEAHNKNKS